MKPSSIIDSFKSAITIKGQEQKKNQAGSFTLIFSGTFFTLFGFSYFWKSSLFNRTSYITLREALSQMKNKNEINEIPVSVYGKVFHVDKKENGVHEGYAIYKSVTELKTVVFDDTINNWRDSSVNLKVVEDLYDFDIITPNGTVVTVRLTDMNSRRDIMVLSLVKGCRREIVGDEKEEYSRDIGRTHISDSSPIDNGVFMEEEGLKMNHHVYINGVLRKEGDKMIISSGKTSKLIISSKSIDDENSHNTKNGIVISLVGLGLIAGGLYHYFY